MQLLGFSHVVSVLPKDVQGPRLHFLKLHILHPLALNRSELDSVHIWVFANELGDIYEVPL